MKDAAIVALSVILLWFGTSLVRVENERYALFLDMCPRPHNDPLLFPDCTGIETRTSWVWNLAYDLGIF
jgi:hypothetical protein